MRVLRFTISNAHCMALEGMVASSSQAAEVATSTFLSHTASCRGEGGSAALQFGSQDVLPTSGCQQGAGGQCRKLPKCHPRAFSCTCTLPAAAGYVGRSPRAEDAIQNITFIIISSMDCQDSRPGRATHSKPFAMDRHHTPTRHNHPTPDKACTSMPQAQLGAQTIAP